MTGHLIVPLVAETPQESAHQSGPDSDARLHVIFHRLHGLHFFLVWLTCLILAAPQVVDAQTSTQNHRIGVLLTLYTSSEDAPRAFREGLRDLGYVEGKNIVIEWRSAHGDYDQIAALAQDLIQRRVEVIVVDVTPAARAVRQATASTPIVVMASANPVESGLVDSLAHPGGNVTGLSTALPEISAKRLQMLVQAVPQVSRVAVLWNPQTPYHKELLKELAAAAPTLGLQIVPVAAERPGDFERAFASMTSARVNGLYVADDAMFITARAGLILLANKAQLPSVFAHREFPIAGGLLSYGPNHSERFRLAATYVDKILKGTKAADLPVDQAAKLEFVLNLGTARALGLAIPKAVLIQADQVIP